MDVAAPLAPPPSATRAATGSRRQPNHSAADETSKSRKPHVAGTPPPVEAGAPAMAPSLADVKRLKHREYVKRSYNKKIVRVASCGVYPAAW